MKIRNRIDDALKLASAKNGKCLSEICSGAFSRLKWECSTGHQWEAVFNNIRNGCWCPVCSGHIRKTLDDAKKLALVRGGKCLSKEFSNNKKLKWQCNQGHTWDATYQSVKNHWCRLCVGSQKYVIDDVISYIKQYDGKCLSTKYSSKLEFECKYGHQWIGIFSEIKRGRWCPVCSNGLSERIVRIYFETLFNAKFEKIRPDWLPGQNGNLELDGYCAELNLAFEHNGSQHYETVSKFKINNEKLDKIKANDNKKKVICHELGVKLIIIPPLFSRLKLENLRQYIKNQCLKQNILLPSNFDSVDINISKAYTKFDLQLSIIKKKISNRNGKFLSVDFTNCQNCNIKVIYECDKGHLATSTYYSLSQDKWCAKCVWPHSWYGPGSIERNSYSIEYVKGFVKIKRGKCLDTVYKNNETKMQWECEFGHKWLASFSNIKNQNSWCPTCANKLSSINRIGKPFPKRKY